VKERVQRDIDEFLESNSRKMSTCACCDELCRPKGTHDVSLNKRWTDILCLHWTSDVPDAIRADYDVSKVDSRLQTLRNVALSPRGVLEGKRGGNSQLCFCKSCFTSLNNTQLNTPPKFSIANAFGIGDVPDCFKSASWAEIRMVTLAPISGVIKIIGRGRSQRSLHSHTMALINEPGPASTYIPQDITQEDFQVIFANPKDSDRAYAKKKFTQIRRRSVNELAAFVTKNNTAYAGAHRLQEKINSLDDDSTVSGVCVEDGNANLITEVINDSSRVNTFSNASIIERSGGMFNLRPPRPFALEDKVENDDADENGDQIQRFQVKNSVYKIPRARLESHSGSI